MKSIHLINIQELQRIIDGKIHLKRVTKRPNRKFTLEQEIQALHKLMRMHSDLLKNDLLNHVVVDFRLRIYPYEPASVGGL